MQLDTIVATPKAKSNNAAKPSKKNAKEFLRRIHSIDIGYFIPSTEESGQPSKKFTRLNSNEHIKYHRSAGFHLQKWTQKKLAENACGSETYAHTSSAHCGVLVGDIDTHELGDITEALAIARDIKANFLPGIHYEPSTSGTGVHFYFVTDWGWHGDAETTALHVRKQGDRLSGLFTAYAKNRGYEFDVVEVRGTPSFETRTANNLPVLNFGKSCKVPRDVDAVMESPTFQLEEIMAIASDNRDEVTTYRETLAEKVSANPKGIVELFGSTGEKALPITRQDVLDQYQAAEAILKYIPITVNGNKPLRTTVEDIAFMLAILVLFGDCPNEDGSMPTARIKAVWSLCLQHGVTDRQFDSSRFAAMRNAFVDSGLVTMNDNRYSFSTKPGGGKGFAMKWAINSLQLEIVHHLSDLSFSTQDTANAAPTAQQEETNPLVTLFVRTSSDDLAVQRIQREKSRPRWCPLGVMERDRVPIQALAA